MLIVAYFYVFVKYFSHGFYIVFSNFLYYTMILYNCQENILFTMNLNDEYDTDTSMNTAIVRAISTISGCG